MHLNNTCDLPINMAFGLDSVGFGFSIVVVAEKRLCTTTINRLFWSLLFEGGVYCGLLAGCAICHKEL
jgi:hypothetical protein